MKALAFSPAAQADIEAIWEYSAERWGPDQADRYTEEIRDACQTVALGRKHGRVVAVSPGYLKIPTGSHVVFFRDCGGRFEIIRVLHSRQDVERHLQSL